MNLATNKIGSKALIYVSLLLLLEALFVGVYFWLLIQAEQESTRQQKAKEIIATTNDLLNSMYIAGDNVSKSVFHKEEASSNKYEIAKDDVPQKIAWLRTHLDDDPAQLQLLERIDRETNVALKMLAEMKRISDSEAPAVAMHYGIKMRGKMQKHLEGLVHDLIEFLNKEKAVENQTPVAMKFQRDCLRWLLVAALALNVLAALIFAGFFMRSITSRLSVVVDNSSRLLERKSLRPPLVGGDEIAQLDRAFHEMSNSLRGEEELVRASEIQIRAIIDQMPLGVMILEGRESIEYANPTLEKMLECGSGEMVGSRLSDYFVGGSADFLSNLAAAGGAIELTAQKSSGIAMQVELSLVDASLIELSRRIAVVVDVTERHAVEKMRQAFVAMVSHELRTPLTSVAGFLQLLPMGVYGKITDSAGEEAARAESQVDQLVMLVNDLLDLEKLEAGKMELAKNTVFLEDVIDAALESVYSLAEVREMEFLFEGCEFDVFADKERLRQAVSKMLTSMLRLCTIGQKIDLFVERDKREQTVKITSFSRNLSIPAENLESIFEPFHQLNLPSISGSLGLGLTLARAIVTQHGGTCGATASGGGTSIWLSLPSQHGA